MQDTARRVQEAAGEIRRGGVAPQRAGTVLEGGGRAEDLPGGVNLGQQVARVGETAVHPADRGAQVKPIEVDRKGSAEGQEIQARNGSAEAKIELGDQGH